MRSYSRTARTLFDDNDGNDPDDAPLRRRTILATETRHVRQALYHLTVPTTRQGLFDVTADISSWVESQAIQTGLLVVWCRHTSASLLVQANADPEVQADIEAFFTRLAPEGRGLYRHEEEGLDNMPAHLRAALTQVQVCVPVENGRPVFGAFQALYLFEHRNGSHLRDLVLHLAGTA